MELLLGRNWSRKVSTCTRHGWEGSTGKQREPGVAQKMDQYPSANQASGNLVEDRQQDRPDSCCWRQQSEEGGNSHLPRPLACWTPGNFKHLCNDEERLLVAKHETRHQTVHQGLWHLLSQENQYTPLETRNDANYTRTFLTIPDHLYGLHHETPEVRKIQHNPHSHGSWL